jgi:hypothetical protein
MNNKLTIGWHTSISPSIIKGIQFNEMTHVTNNSEYNIITPLFTIYHNEILEHDTELPREILEHDTELPREILEHDTELQCPICYENYPQIENIQMGCHHNFCRRCIARWFTTARSSCPLCRA